MLDDALTLDELAALVDWLSKPQPTPAPEEYVRPGRETIGTAHAKIKTRRMVMLAEQAAAEAAGPEPDFPAPSVAGEPTRVVDPNGCGDPECHPGCRNYPSPRATDEPSLAERDPGFDQVERRPEGLTAADKGMDGGARMSAGWVRDA